MNVQSLLKGFEPVVDERMLSLDAGTEIRTFFRNLPRREKDRLFRQIILVPFFEPRRIIGSSGFVRVNSFLASLDHFCLGPLHFFMSTFGFCAARPSLFSL
ncbi:MAG: hypothetical protein EON58_11665, partial [Alphaproteobacteria bacterium]